MRPSSVVMRTRICLPMPAAHDDSGVDGASGMASGIAPTPVIFIERRPCYPGSAALTTSQARGGGLPAPVDVDGPGAADLDLEPTHLCELVGDGCLCHGHILLGDSRRLDLELDPPDLHPDRLGLDGRARVEGDGAPLSRKA